MNNQLADWVTQLNWVDVAVSALLLFSLIVGLVRGFFSQIAGIIGVLGAMLLAFYCAPPVTQWLIDVTPSLHPSTAVILTFSVLFLTTWGLWMVLCHYLKKLLMKLKFGAFDRVLGGAFGLVKGALVAYVVLILILGFMPTSGSMNQEISDSVASQKGLKIIDEFLQAQKHHVPKAAWNIIAQFRNFPEEGEVEPNSTSETKTDS